ncbi:hypothetical protein GXW82_00820 [Streptacidiphilus sp. 4-A2]|nr:hypothetical protein [Streptacidiphilus sp. 4-A2]
MPSVPGPALTDLVQRLGLHPGGGRFGDGVVEVAPGAGMLGGGFLDSAQSGSLVGAVGLGLLW